MVAGLVQDSGLELAAGLELVAELELVAGLEQDSGLGQAVVMEGQREHSGEQAQQEAVLDHFV